MATHRKSSDISGDQRKVFDALINIWLRETKPGIAILEGVGSVDLARVAVYQLYDRGLIEFVTKTTRRRDVIPFKIRLTGNGAMVFGGALR